MLDTARQLILTHVNGIIGTAPTPIAKLWHAARVAFEAGDPRALARYLREVLKAHEQDARNPVLPGDACSGPRNVRLDAQVSARYVCDRLEEIAAEYGNRTVWGVEQEEREEDQNTEVVSYVLAVMRGINDSQTGEKWFVAATSFNDGNPIPLLGLVGEIEGYEASRIANILMARLAG